jgi:N-formylmethionyl-tRNA deformylase
MNKLLDIAQLGDPVLRQQAKKVGDVNDPVMLAIIEDMLFTLSASNGVGPCCTASIKITGYCDCCFQTLKALSISA